nr:hypothetical protein [Tanacetum cinerariifolium]
MAWLPICGELRRSFNPVQLEPMFVLYCQMSVTEDYKLAREITRVSGKVNNVVITQAQFLEELDSLGTRHVPAKMTEFFHEIQRKDCEKVDKL